MEIYVAIEDGQPVQASENFGRLEKWVKQYAEQVFADGYDDDEAELNIDGLEAEISVDGETQWSLTYVTVNLL